MQAPIPVKETPVFTANNIHDSKLKYENPETNPTDIPLSKIQELVDYLTKHKKMLLLYALKNDVSIEEFGNGRIKMALSEKIQPDFMLNLQKVLEECSGRKWQIEIRRGPLGETLADQEKAALEQDKRCILEYPLVKAILQEFKGAKIDTVTRKNNVENLDNDDEIITNFDEDE